MLNFAKLKILGKTDFREISHRFRIFSFNSFYQKNAEYGEKVCELQTKILAFFRESFRSLETLLHKRLYRIYSVFSYIMVPQSS